MKWPVQRHSAGDGRAGIDCRSSGFRVPPRETRAWPLAPGYTIDHGGQCQPCIYGRLVTGKVSREVKDRGHDV
jgi:hypothetical protein